jgi:S1-C subfamily serine protease
VLQRLQPAVVVAVALGLSVTGGGLHAQDSRPAARDIVKKWQDAIVNVRVVLKTRMSMGGREMQSTDDSVDAVGTVIDPSGLTVMSLGSLNPAAMMNKLMGSASTGDQKIEITSEPSDVKIRLPDGRELPAKIVLRDEDLDLAFITPTTKPTGALTSINMSESSKLSCSTASDASAGGRPVRPCTTWAPSSSGRGRSSCWPARPPVWERRRSR